MVSGHSASLLVTENLLFNVTACFPSIKVDNDALDKAVDDPTLNNELRIQVCQCPGLWHLIHTCFTLLDRNNLLLNVATGKVDSLLLKLSPGVNVVMMPATELICSEASLTVYFVM